MGNLEERIDLLSNSKVSRSELKSLLMDILLSVSEPEPGEPGKSIFQIAVDNGFTGSEQDFIEFQRGNDGIAPFKLVGSWDVASNPTLTGITLLDQESVQVNVAGTSSITGIETHFEVGDSLYFDGTNYLRLRRADLALKKVQQMERDLYEIGTLKAYDAPGGSFTNWRVSTAFHGVAVAGKLDEGITIHSLSVSLSHVAATTELQLDFVKRPIADSENTLRFGEPVTDIRLITNKRYASNLFAATNDLQEVVLQFDAPIITEPDFVYGWVIRAWNGTERTYVGFDGQSIANMTLSQAEKGFTYNLSGVAAKITAAGRPAFAFLTDGPVIPKMAKISEHTTQIATLNNLATDNSSKIVLLDNKISGVTKPTILWNAGILSLYNEAVVKGGWTIDDDSIVSSEIGTTAFIGLYRDYRIHRRRCTVTVTIGESSRFALHTRDFSDTTVHTYSTFTELDASTNTVKLYRAYNPPAMPDVLQSVSFPLTPGKYTVELIKEDYKNSVRVINLQTGRSVTITDDQDLSGRQHDRYCIANLGGSPVRVHDLVVDTPIQPGCEFAFEGDSNFEVPYLTSHKGVAHLFLESVNGNGYIAGRGAGNIDGVLRSLVNTGAILKPKNTVVMIGTNAGNTLAKLRQAVNTIQGYNSIPWLCNIPAQLGGAVGGAIEVAAANQLIQDVRAEFAIGGALMDVATSVGGDPSLGIDLSICHQSSGVRNHFIDEGHLYMFNMLNQSIRL